MSMTKLHGHINLDHKYFSSPYFLRSFLLMPSSSTQPAATTDTDKKHHCPFPRCGSSYTRAGKRREHLLKQKTLMDEAHPHDHPMWETAQQNGLLRVFSSPKNLTEEEKHARQKAAGLRCWNKNRDSYLNNQRKSRENVKKALIAPAKLTTIQAWQNKPSGLGSVCSDKLRAGKFPL